MADERDRGGQRDGRPPAGGGPAARPSPADAPLDLDPDIEILDDPTPPRSTDGGPDGPDPDQVRKFLRAGVDRIDGRRAARGLPRLGWRDRDYKRKAKAQAQYVERGQTLLARYKHECGLVSMSTEDLDPREFVDWLFSFKLNLTAASWRTYRLAARACVQALPHVYGPEALAMLEGDIGAGAEETRPPKPEEVGDAEVRASTRIDKTHVDAVLATLPTFSRSEMVVPLRDWIVAALATGLQPSEWATAILETQKDTKQPRRRAWLHVVNPRAGHPLYRTIEISDFSGEAFGAVERMVERAPAWSLEQKFDLRRSQCTTLLADVHAALFPRQRRRCVLETLHAQFLHNMKTKYSPAEVAALVGYVGNDALVERGKRRLAWPDPQIVDVPVPMVAAVTQMRQRIETYETRQEASRMRAELKERRRQRKAATHPASDADGDSDPSE